VFDPKPSQHPCFSYTIVGLLSQASNLFKENFSKLISQFLNVDITMFLPSPGNKFEWIKTNENPLFYNYRYKSFNTEMDSLKHMRLNKEWNEEFQAIIDLNFNGDPLQNLTKEKLLFDFYKMFKDTAIEGAKLIRDKKITPFNFFDNPRANSGYYMYGSIFFTVLEDSYLDFRTFTVEDQRQTCLGSNLDLRHINYLNSIRHKLDLKEFYFSLNCIVQYKGLRVHAQVITPGVIFNSEHLVEYGEGEEGIIKYNEKFHEEYKKICEKLNIREVNVIDKNGKEFSVCGNPEIKGVRGVDKRKYLFDLIHLFPRDLNYIGPDNNGCLLRPELIKEYQLKLIHSKTTSDHQEELKKLNSEPPGEIKDPASYFQFVEEKYKKKEELFEKVNSEVKPFLYMDTTIGIENKYFQYKNENFEKDEEYLKNLSKFLKEDVLRKFLTDVSRDEENAPNDSFSITEYMHKYGIPMRYYGEIVRLIESEQNFKKMNNWVKSLAIRDILRRSFKHIFNNLIRDVPDYLIKEFCAYFLNILLSPASLIKAIENFDMVYSNGVMTNVKSTNLDSEKIEQTIQNTNVTKETDAKKKKRIKKKKNKNKDKDKTGQSESELELKFLISDTLSGNNKFYNSLFEINNEEIKKYFIKPSEMWSKLKNLALKRYGYKFPDKTNFDYVDSVINKFGLLRDICLTLGIQIEALDYELQFDISSINRMDNFKYSQMPFKSDNIIDLFPVVKDSNLPSEIHKPIFEQAEALFKAGSFIESSEKYKQIIYLSNEVYGQINYYSGIAHKKLGEISYLDGDYMNGIIMIQKSIVILEKLYDYDTSIVANAYSELSTYYHLINQDYLAFKYISRGLEILNFTYPKNVNLYF
jgi:protein TIF31